MNSINHVLTSAALQQLSLSMDASSVDHVLPLSLILHSRLKIPSLLPLVKDLPCSHAAIPSQSPAWLGFALTLRSPVEFVQSRPSSQLQAAMCRLLSIQIAGRAPFLCEEPQDKPGRILCSSASGIVACCAVITRIVACRSGWWLLVPSYLSCLSSRSFPCITTSVSQAPAHHAWKRRSGGQTP